MKCLLTILIIFSLCSNLYAQSLDTLMTYIGKAQRERLKSMKNDDKREFMYYMLEQNLGVLFEKMRQEPLSALNRKPYFKINPFKRKMSSHKIASLLVSNLVISSSKDNKLCVLSYDNLTGECTHLYTNYLQYMGANNQYQTVKIFNEFSIGYYHIEEVKSAGNTYYLLYGYGSHCSAKQEQIVRVFTFYDGILQECHSCYPNGKFLRIKYNQGEEIDLHFDSKTQTLTYKESLYDEGNEWSYSKGFVQKQWEFKNGQLKKVK